MPLIRQPLIIPRGLLLDHWQEDWSELTQQLQCASIHLNYRLLTPERIKLFKQQGLKILAYTVNQPDLARQLLKQGADMICTDRNDMIGPDFSE